MAPLIFCPAIDSKQHRHTCCPAMYHVYEKYSDLIPTLKEFDPMHCDLPVVFLPSQHDFHKFCYFQILEVSITDEAHLLSNILEQEGQTPVFFFDGSADNPDHPDLPKAS